MAMLTTDRCSTRSELTSCWCYEPLPPVRLLVSQNTNRSGRRCDESPGRGYAAGCGGVRLLLCRPEHSQARMLASTADAGETGTPLAARPGARARRRGPLLRRRARHARPPLARGAAPLLAVAGPVRDARAPRRGSSRSCRSRCSRSGAPSRSPGRSSPTAAGTTRTARSSTSPFALVGAFLAGRAAAAPLRPLARSSAPSASGRSRGKVLPWLYEDYGRDRPPARARRLLERARAARRHRAAARPLPRHPDADGRHAARLRLDRRDRADVLARRGLVAVVVVALWMCALARLDRGALRRCRGRAARGRARSRSPSPCPG